MRLLPPVLATALAATSLLPAPALAQAKAIKGQATMYELQSGGGNCSYPSSPAGNLYAALSPGEYAAAAACGGYLDVTGPKGTVRVKVVDQCPECAAGHIDLSRTAFARVADPAKGLVGVTYRPVSNPRVGSPLSFRVKEGSSQWWLALLVIDHGNPLTSVEVKGAGGAWRKLARADYNYWIADSGAGQGPFTVRVTDTRGHKVTAKGIRLAPAAVQRTTTKMY
ncbi:expansin EXLX1 family cellulose-binding protein [Nonomuraea guangzhouensis]|uniref:Expansin EXLX1 family cellulose-binding protein n=1 Tax=Nonomuraea guangzhouensis TaxID=1291555 RepID=A0ABW4GX60_9ACTN|nr:expansin EXLX1 family cellulose-binding protein [Nonomuraea guangzhouensis]